ncbi:protein PROCA1 [Theristicus caerulescens]
MPRPGRLHTWVPAAGLSRAGRSRGASQTATAERGQPLRAGPPPAPLASWALGRCQAGALPVGRRCAPTGLCCPSQAVAWWGALGLGHSHPAQVSPAPSRLHQQRQGTVRVAQCPRHPQVQGSASQGDAQGAALQPAESRAAQGLSEATHVSVGVSGRHPAPPSAGSLGRPACQIRARVANGLRGGGASRGGRALAAVLGAAGRLRAASPGRAQGTGAAPAKGTTEHPWDGTGGRGEHPSPTGAAPGPGAGASRGGRVAPHITPPAATATGPGPAGRGDPFPRLPARDGRGAGERLQHPALRAAPQAAGPPRGGGLRRAIRRPHGGERRGALCAPGLLRRHLLLLLFLLLLLLLLLLAAAPGAAPGTGAAPPGRPRARRGLTYPGTLWCGAGSNADAYEQLGEHRDTDRCCRDHDHCQHVIHPFTARYGYRNLRWHTISHCDCDLRLKECLRQVNDTASRVVGQAFFNVIQVPCFEFAYKEECVEPYLYVWCKAYNTVAVAVPREPVLYEFGGELIDRAARPGGVPLSPLWSSVGGGAVPVEHHVPARPPSPRKTAKKERKGKKKDKKKKGEGLKKKGPSENREPSRPAAAAPTGQDAQAPLPDVGGAANTILRDAPAWEGLGREPSAAPPPLVHTTSGKRRRKKERNRKKRLKSKAEAEPAREPQP